MSEKPTNQGTTRREFLTTAAVAGAAVATGLAWTQNVHAAGTDEIKVGLIGCGGRGSGAVDNVLHSAKGVKIVALGDVFPDRLDGCRHEILEKSVKKPAVVNLGNSADLPVERCFVGLDAYKKVLDQDVNYVILATPPGFRPLHLEAAVAAGKNIFTEKPVGTDAVHLQKVFTLVDEAKKKKLAIAAGTQRRHQLGYIETMKRLHDGEIGDIVGGRSYWAQNLLWARPRKPGMSDAAYQIHNWYNFAWICGDHIVEQHVHNIDVINWAIGSPPVAAVGMGYKTRTDPAFHNIFDFFAIDFEYPKGVHVISMCRQISDCWGSVSEAVQGTKGQCQVNAYSINGKRVLSREQDQASTDPYVQEHTDLIASIRKGEPINELQNVAESTLTAIMGRMSAYSGKQVTWDFVTKKSTEDLFPKNLTWDSSLPEPPLPIPGKYPLV
jgi:myo-inositol 2-dehydrogenase / D-chiro-inositol 1-dehydrogenase